MIITFPSGREITGRILHWFPWGRADVSVERPNARRWPHTDVRCYPKSWIKPRKETT